MQQSMEDSSPTGPLLSVLMIALGNEYYALPSASVREIVRYRAWTAVPGAPPTLPGLISQRGVILPIVDLRSMLGLLDTDPDRRARLVVIQHHDIDFALLVDVALDLIDLDQSELDLAPGAFEQRRVRFVRGVAKYDQQPLALIDLDALIGLLREGA